MIQRRLQLVQLDPSKHDEYLGLHAAVWPEISERMTSGGIRNYTIFMRGEMLIAYFEYVGDDYEGDMAAMATDPSMRRWWALTDACQVPLPDSQAERLWVEADEIFHLA